MSSSARQPLAAWRNEACVFQIQVPGVDLTGKALRLQARSDPDAPGAPAIDLATVTSANAQGLRLAPVTTTNGAPSSIVQVRINKSTLQGLPYAGELGDPLELAYALQIDGVTRMFGPLAVLASAIDSDGAPADRPVSYGTQSTAGSPADGVVLTITDTGVTVSVQGVELLAPLVVQAQAAADAARNIRDTMPTYFKGDPGGDGNVAVGRQQLKAVQASTADLWYLSEGLRSGNFELLPADFVAPSDPAEAVFIKTANGRWMRRLDYLEGINIGWCGAKCDAVEANGTATGTNDRAAVQAAINLAALLSVATVWIPGPTLLGNGFDTTNNVNAQLVLPTSSDPATEMTIALRGTSSPALSGGVAGGPALISTDTAGLGDGVICSVVACPFVNQPEGRSWTSLMVQDLIIRTPQNSPSSGIDGRYLHTLGLRGVRVDVFGGFGAGPNGVTLLQNRYAASYGIIGSYNNIPLWNTHDEVLVFGYNKGLFVGELSTIGAMCISACETAVVFPLCQHPTVIDRLLVLSCVRTMQVVGNHEVQCQELNIEHTPLPDGWDARTYDIDSDAAYLRGNIEWHIHEAPYQLTVKDGADLNVNLTQRPPYQQSGTAFGNIFPGFNEVVSVSGLKNIVDLRTGRIPWLSYVAARTGQYDAVGAISWSNYDKDRPDARVAQISAQLDGAIGRGQVVLSTMRDGTMKDHVALDSLGRLVFLSLPPQYDSSDAAKSAGIAAGTLCIKSDRSLFIA